MSSKPEFLVLGTLNRKKLKEMEELLRPMGWCVKALDAFPSHLAVKETGQTFAENAALKASQQALALNAWVIADDSGLEVFALRGKPGIYSARYAGESATDEDNNRELLVAMKPLAGEKRLARYVCHLALADPSGTIRISCEDYCMGMIRSEHSGQGGFGYDPLFEVLEYHQTFGQLGPTVKSCLSHRGRAMRTFAKMLERLW